MSTQAHCASSSIAAPARAVAALLLALAGAAFAAASDGIDAAPALLAGVAMHDPGKPGGMRARISALSGALLGRPYLRDPLGEGAGAPIDADPLVRLDGFDCVTYVETVLALARARQAEQVLPQMLSLRYLSDGASFEQRTHLPTLDWLPNALARGVLADVTAQLFPQPALAAATVEIDRGQALRLLAHGAPAGEGATKKMQRSTLRYVRLQTLLRSADSGTLNTRIPDGTVALVVGPQAPGLRGAGIAEAIYHFGFVVRDAHGVLQFRSATPAGDRAVRDLPLADYLLDGARKGVMLGLVLLQPLPV